MYTTRIHIDRICNYKVLMGCVNINNNLFQRLNPTRYEIIGKTELTFRKPTREKQIFPYYIFVTMRSLYVISKFDSR